MPPDGLALPILPRQVTSTADPSLLKARGGRPGGNGCWTTETALQPVT